MDLDIQEGINMLAIENRPVVSFLDVKSREEAIKTLVSKLDIDHSKVFDAVMQRERVVSTGIGIGIAIPHAKIEEIDDFYVAIGIIKNEGVDWDAIDHLPVKLVLLICGPQERHGEYLQLLSKLTKKIKEEETRRALFVAKTEEEVVKIFQEC
ncbi:MAG: PTS sugar transporter subunit IIA [Chlamydiae bacterium]|jgi:PTS system nitrogen regulatory IIA component|nr:PTS sugar transporter subunit IIA [Chlamydiota bacterium]